ncbi:MAG TPA: hypothetical protein VD846_05175 [Allosphingosinicella sp.]|nr:hypothetical protein [Allosphingosinicella sp.]
MTASPIPNRAVWLALAACLGGAAAAAAEDPLRIDPVQPAATARYPDAAEIARASRISEAEAARRLRLQEVSAPYVSKLRREFAGRLAGLYRESEGDYRLVVRLKGDSPVADRWIGGGRDRMRIQFLPGAPATLAESLEKVAANLPAIGARLPGLMGTGVDERTGEVMLDVHAVGEDVERARAAEPAVERLLGHPVRIEISAARLSDGQASARPVPGPPAPGSREWNGHMQRLARSARYPGYPHPGILNFHRESRPLISRVQAEPAFAGWVFKNDNEPHAVVLFTGDAAAHLARYTRDPRYWPKSVGLTQTQLRALQDSFGRLLRQLEIHYTFSSGDEENNRVTFSVSEMDRYNRAVADGRLKPHPHVVIVQDKGPIARTVQSAGPVTHFPQFKFPGRLMDAALSGTLEVKNGCLTIGDNLILWPSRARLSVGSDGVPAVGGGKGAPLRPGDQVRMGGGTAWTDFRGEGLLQPLPAACAGEALDTDKLWVAGEF